MSDRVAFVTGASRGIGKQLAGDLAQAGYDVVCTARSTSASPGQLPGTIEETAAQVEKHGQRSLVIALDVRNEEAIASAAREVADQFGRCDLLVNNAAIAPPKPALQDSTRRWNNAVAANINGPFWLMYYLREQLEASPGGGRIVNISSGASMAPDFGRISYTTTKRALEAMTEASAFDLRGKVGVNCIRLEVQVWTEGYEATLPKDTDFSVFEDPVIMSDAVLWLAQQDLKFSGRVLTIAELRELGAVRPKTSIADRR